MNAESPEIVNLYWKSSISEGDTVFEHSRTIVINPNLTEDYVIEEISPETQILYANRYGYLFFDLSEVHANLFQQIYSYLYDR